MSIWKCTKFTCFVHTESSFGSYVVFFLAQRFSVKNVATSALGHDCAGKRHNCA
jgi:hypothetical protein